MNELIARCAGTFIPTGADDFIGDNIITRSDQSVRIGARAIALHLDKAVRQARRSGNTPIKVLFNGPPGLGKSGLMKYAQHLTGCNKWSTTKLNGTAVKVERVEEIERSFQYRTLFGDWRMLWIDEADEIPRVAQVRLLTLLDDLPPGVFVGCTSNCALKDFENRFQTRFQVFELAPPPADVIEKFLLRLAPDLGRGAKTIAQMACGNVRQALLDAQGMLQQSEPELAA